MLYFAYGSNTDPRRMQDRCPGAVQVSSAWLGQVRLTYGGPSKSWKGGVATVVASPIRGARIPGVLWEVTEKHQKALDRVEGHPNFYVRQEVKVEVEGEDGPVQAFTYVLRGNVSWYPPTVEYLAALKAGYAANGWNTTSLPNHPENTEEAALRFRRD